MKFILTFVFTIFVGFFSFAQSKKVSPKAVLPFVYDGIEYRVPHLASTTQGMKHDGGYLELINKKSNTRISLIEIYSQADKDKPVFIKSLRVEGDNLLIEDDSGKVHSLSVAREGKG